MCPSTPSPFQGTLTFLGHSPDQGCKCSPEEFESWCRHQALLWSLYEEKVFEQSQQNWAEARMPFFPKFLFSQGFRSSDLADTSITSQTLPLSQNHRTIKLVRDPGGHLVHHPSSRTTYSWLPRTMSRELFQWGRLCSHYGKPAPVLSLPHNKSSVSWCLSLCPLPFSFIPAQRFSFNSKWGPSLPLYFAVLI